MRQVQSFIAAVGPALVTVSSMAIKCRKRLSGFHIPGLDVASVLGPLASACPRLQKLKVTGDVGVPLLTAFGSACGSLTFLETFNVPAETLERLGELIPRVRSTEIALFWDDLFNYEEEDAENPEEFLLAISSCSTLTSLNIGVRDLTQDVWLALPPSIEKLHAGEYCISDALETQQQQPPKQPRLPNLRKVVSIHENIPLCSVANLLSASPGLQELAIGDVWVPCNVSSIPHLVVVNERLGHADLTVRDSYMRGDSGWPKDGMLLSLIDVEDETPTSLFVSKLPVLEHFKSMQLQTMEEPLLTGLATAFPRLDTLLVCSFVGVRQLPGLILFPMLERLDLWSVKNRLSTKNMRVLLLKMRLLRHLRFQAAGVDCRELGLMMRRKGRVVWVECYEDSENELRGVE